VFTNSLLHKKVIRPQRAKHLMIPDASTGGRLLAEEQPQFLHVLQVFERRHHGRKLSLGHDCDEFSSLAPRCDSIFVQLSATNSSRSAAFFFFSVAWSAACFSCAVVVCRCVSSKICIFVTRTRAARSRSCELNIHLCTAALAKPFSRGTSPARVPAQEHA